jgi:hypothetical protein
MAFDLQMYQLKRERGLLGEMVGIVERAVEEHSAYPVWSYVLLDVDTELGHEARARASSNGWRPRASRSIWRCSGCSA